MPTHFHVISHTHWDREWYHPFERFRIRLIDMMDNLLDVLRRYPSYRFHLDAQTIVIEDYLVVKPERRKTIGDLVRSGRILAGPWYVQNDFNLTSGEATIRNLLIGKAMAEELGGCTMVGYMPDQFGLTSQLPQILKRFGIETALFGRGYHFEKPRKAEILWKGADGTEIFAVNMPLWYNNAQRFPAHLDQAQRLVEGNRKYLRHFTAADHLLLMNGVDNLEAQEDLLPILENLSPRLPKGDRIFQSTLPEYMEQLREQLQGSVSDLPVLAGELRFGEENRIMTGTLSSRYYLKQANHRIQLLLEKQIEPLYSCLRWSGIPEYPSDLLRFQWKLLIQNHPHDDICGCSADAVHEHMMDRFARVEEIGSELRERGMRLILSYLNKSGLSDDQYLLLFFNPLPFRRMEVVEAVIDIPAEEDTGQIEIADHNGNAIPFVVLGSRRKARGLLSPINLPGVLEVSSYRVLLPAKDIPGLGYKSLVVRSKRSASQMSAGMKSAEQPLADRPPSRQAPGILENEHLRVTLKDNAAVDILHKASGTAYRDMLLIEDREDMGDAYVYRDNPDLNPILSRDNSVVSLVEEENGLRTSISMSYSLTVPQEYSFQEKRRSVETVEVPICIRLSSCQGSPWLEVGIMLDNQAKDHRLRVLFPTGIEGDTTLASMPFDVVRRNREDIREGVLKVGRQPFSEYVAIEDSKRGVAFFAEGLYEYEHLDGGTIALTLLRGNGFISNEQTGLPMEESWLVPGNQCLGQAEFRLAICPYGGGLVDAEIPLVNARFQTPLVCEFQPVDERKFSGGRPFVQDTEIDAVFFREKKYPHVSLPVETRFLEIQGKGLLLSALKKAESGGSLIVRIYNADENATDAALGFFVGIKAVYRMNLAEEREEEMAIEDGRALRGEMVTADGGAIEDGKAAGSAGQVRFSVGSKEIVSLELVLD